MEKREGIARDEMTEKNETFLPRRFHENCIPRKYPYFTTAQDAKEEVLKRIPLDATIGIGGSVTIREMGLLEV